MAAKTLEDKLLNEKVQNEQTLTILNCQSNHYSNYKYRFCFQNLSPKCLFVKSVYHSCLTLLSLLLKREMQIQKCILAKKVIAHGL